MKTYAITIKPLSGFGTPLKGDTLFGHICWQSAYDDGLFGMSLDKLLADYSANPFIVVSSAYPELKNGYAVKRPDMPLDMLFDFKGNDRASIIGKRKEIKKRRWMLILDGQRITSLKTECMYLSDEELYEKLCDIENTGAQRQIHKSAVRSFACDYSQPHNTINRLTGTTGEGQFAPFSVDQVVYMSQMRLVVFAGVREDIPVECCIEALKKIGETGFGKDASTGLGRFEVEGYKEIALSDMGSESPDACYTLAPCVPEKNAFTDMFYIPFTRFGRHGDVFSKSGKPFKNPVIMADEGAVFKVNNSEVFNKPYIGTAVSNISKIEPQAVTQGYSLYIPVKVEDSYE